MLFEIPTVKGLFESKGAVSESKAARTWRSPARRVGAKHVACLQLQGGGDMSLPYIPQYN